MPMCMSYPVVSLSLIAGRALDKEERPGCLVSQRAVQPSRRRRSAKLKATSMQDLHPYMF